MIEHGRSAVRHGLCVLALMWIALANGQPFFFPDTTSYVRAGDAAAYMVSHGRFSTVWTDRFKQGADAHLAGKPQTQPVPSTSTPAAAGNDLSAGNVMSGRSPYFGALLYVSYLISNFWFFVVAQAIVSYALILLSLRHFGLDRPRVAIGMTAFLAIGTDLPYFNALLMPDALAAFGILAYLLIITNRGELRRPTMIFLYLVMITSTISHLTHICMLLAMLASLGVAKIAGWAAPRRQAWFAGAVAVTIGLISVAATSAVTNAVFKKPPQLVPLMTARFIADGPGARFMAEGCGGHDFVICKFRVPQKISSDNFLWSTDPASGVYLLATPQQRSLMSAQDTKFAMAVLKAHPFTQGGLLVLNTLKQAAWFPSKGLNSGCAPQQDCWHSLPDPVRATFVRTPSARSLFPVWPISYFHYAIVIATVILFAARLSAARRADRQLTGDIILWAALFLIAMLICDALGGAISQPQFRYQGRIIWLIPLIGVIPALMARRSGSFQTEPA